MNQDKELEYFKEKAFRIALFLGKLSMWFEQAVSDLETRSNISIDAEISYRKCREEMREFLEEEFYTKTEKEIKCNS